MAEQPSFSYPVILDLRGKPCLVVGGGTVAARKVDRLLQSGARVTVVAPEVAPALAELACDSTITLHQRDFHPGDLDGQTLVFGALDDPNSRQTLAEEARQRGIPANLADDPKNSDFTIPSSFRRGDLLITVSTGGKSPALSRKLRQVLETKVGPSFATQVEAMGQVRQRLFNELPEHEDLRREVLLGIVDSDLLDVLRKGDERSFQQRVDQMITKAVERASQHE